MAKGGKGMLSGLKRTNPPQMAAGDPKTPKKSVDADAVRKSTAKTPKTLGPRYA